MDKKVTRAIHQGPIQSSVPIVIGTYHAIIVRCLHFRILKTPIYPFMPRIIAVCLLLLPVTAFSQYKWGRPHVVKDNVACLYGLKNDSNQWVVNPQFTKLDDINTYYVAHNNNSKSGIINLRGKLILPVIYESIQAVGDHRKEPDLFIVSKDSKYGLVDSLGKEILPLVYDKLDFVYLAVFPHRYFVLKKGEEFALIDNTLKYFIPFSQNKLEIESRDHIYLHLRVIDKEGKIGLADSAGIRIQPQYRAVSGFDGVRFLASDWKTNKRGLVSISGDTLLPFDHSEIGFTGMPEKRIIALRENTFGVLDSSLRVIIPEGTAFIEGEYNSHVPRSSKYTVAARRENKWGLLTGNGVWVTEQNYDTIIYPNFIPEGSSRHYIAKQNGKYGVMGTKGQVLIPFEYDVLVQCSDTRSHSSQSGCIVTSYITGSYFFIGKKNGYYGATKSDGKNFIPYIYDTIMPPHPDNNSWYYRTYPEMRYANGDQYFLGNGTALHLHRSSEHYGYSSSSWTSTLTYFFDANKDIKIYRNEDTYYAFNEIHVGNRKMLSPDPEPDVRTDPNNENQIQVKTGSYYNEKILYFDSKTGKPVVNPLEGIMVVDHVGENLMYLSTDSLLGIINPQGKVILQPIYIGMYTAPAFGGKLYLWTKTTIDTTCGSYDPGEDCACGWRLCNMNGVPVVKYVFDFPQPLSAEVLPMYIDGKAGLFNVKELKFVRSPIDIDIVDFYSANARNHEYSYPEIHFFYVTRENGQFGVMSSKGKWMTDSTYEYMIPFPRRNYLAARSSRTNQFTERRWLLTGSQNKTMIDATGRLTSDSLLIDSLITQSFIMHDYRGYDHNIWGSNIPEYMQSGPQVGFRSYPTYRNGVLLTPEKDSLYNSAFRSGLEFLLSNYEYRFHQTPGSYATGGTAYVVGQWIHERNAYHNTVSPHQSENLHAEVIYYSDKAMSIVTHFNPDTSEKAKNNLGPYNFNFQRDNSGQYIPVTFDSIFCPTVAYEFVLNKLIRNAVKKREDLNIDCGNEDSYFLRTQGRFYFSDTGLVFNLSNAVIGIPWAQLQPYSRPGGIVDRFIGNQNGEHCRPAYDTTVVNYTAQGYTTMKQLQESGYMKREKITSYHYLFSDSVNHIVSGIRYCNGGDMVIDVFFDPVVVENVSVRSIAFSEKAKMPKAIRKKNIVNFYSIKHYPCVH